MLKKIKKIIIENKVLSSVILPMYYFPNEISVWRSTKKSLKNALLDSTPKIFYIGIPVHKNLGDLAQGVCIRKWLKKHYPERTIIEIETGALVDTHFSLLRLLSKCYNPNDYIVFQSGYTTTDLGGHSDEMHRAVMEAIPNAKILMMPQTIFFEKKENQERTSYVYNKMHNMLFLARDKVSYDMALKMFPDINVQLYPDIVTTLIGKEEFSYERNGIMMCCRDDGEKFYSDEELSVLENKLKAISALSRTDTTKDGSTKDIVSNAEKYIYDEIDKYARFKLVITDRYHGTILSLAAGTPVIVLKTTDHKVTTGADWFADCYKDYIYTAKDLDDAYRTAEDVLKKNLKYKLYPVFEEKYYDTLPALFRNVISEVKE